MGKDLAERFPAARAVFDAIDEALGVELSRIMFEGPEEDLTATQNAQPGWKDARWMGGYLTNSAP